MERRATIFFVVFGGIIAVVTMAAFVWFYAKLIEAEINGVGASTVVRSGTELSEKTIQVLIDENIIEPGDTVQYFYSYGIFSLLEGGSVLTDKEVIVYEPGEEESTDVYLYKLDEVERIAMTVKGDFWTDEVYQISGSDAESWIKIELSVEDEKHLDFVGALYESTPNLKNDRPDN